MAWLGAVYRQCPASLLDLRTLPPIPPRHIRPVASISSTPQLPRPCPPPYCSASYPPPLPPPPHGDKLS